MKIKKFKTLAFLFSLLLPASFALAAIPNLSVSPSAGVFGARQNIDLSISLNSSGNKICAIEGVIDFKNLDCQKIILADGLVSVKMPTCSDPYFQIGIPLCTAVDKNIFVVSVVPSNEGTAILDFEKVGIFGSGNFLSSDASAGNYEIKNFTAKIENISVGSTTNVQVKNILPKEKVATEKPISPSGEVSTTSVSSQNQNQNSNLALAVSASSTNSKFFNTKNTILVILILIIVGLTFYFYRQKYPKNDQN